MLKKVSILTETSKQSFLVSGNKKFFLFLITVIIIMPDYNYSIFRLETYCSAKLKFTAIIFSLTERFWLGFWILPWIFLLLSLWVLGFCCKLLSLSTTMFLPSSCSELVLFLRLKFYQINCLKLSFFARFTLDKITCFSYIDIDWLSLPHRQHRRIP